MFRGFLIATLLFSGCSGWSDDNWWPLNRHDDTTTTRFEPGWYAGMLYLDVGTYLGPVRIRHAACASFIELLVDDEAEALISGYGSCDLEFYNEVVVEVSGNLDALPEVSGTLLAGPVEAEWIGLFIEEDTLYGETTGKTPYNNLQLHFDGYFYAERRYPM